MGKIPFLMIFQFFGIISAWSTKALEDGKVTAAEGLELVATLAACLGVELEFDITDYLVKPKIADPKPNEKAVPDKQD